MNIVLVMNVPYEPALGGANKANRLIAEQLACRGHRMRVLAPALGVPVRQTEQEFEESFTLRGVSIERLGGVVRFDSAGVDVHAVTDRSQFGAHLVRCINEDQPDCVIVSSEEPTQNLLRIALAASPSVVYLLHTLLFLPFGPASLYPGPRRTELFRRVARIIAVSESAAAYVRQWAALEASVCYLPVYATGPVPRFGRHDDGFVLMINPCGYKGIDIFLALAARLPDLPFAAVPGWGTTAADLERLESMPNVTLLEPNPDISVVLRRARLLLMPSLVMETFGLIIVESMRLGIPVIASETGGTTEAGLGVASLIPIIPIRKFSGRLDDNQLPIAVIPEQSIEGWVEAVQRLIGSEHCYRRQADAGVSRAAEFIDNLRVDRLEALLMSVLHIEA
jgi:glycosyltransferase involved in cell wall biosynthesis